MNTSVLQVEAATDPAGWISLGELNEVFSGRNCRALKIAGLQIGLYRIDGEIYALDDLCTHGNARLTEGDVEGFEVECPLHAGVFDIRSGKALSAPLTRDVRSHALQMHEGQLLIRLSQ